ncbi:hypothetical protein FRC01_013157 [Tulasnella sp. 417]|nr:hypothetical protein FRC01_013157 [Tulasnella sp. 417]
MKPLSPPSNRGRRPPERDTVKLQDEELVWDALTGRNIEQTLAKALVARATYIFYREEELRPRTRPEDRSRDLKLRADQAEVFTAIMRRTKEIISRDNTERSFLEHWGESFEAFVVQVNPVPAVVDDEAKEALFCFAVEVLSTSKILFGTLESGWNSQVIEGYWRLLDWGILTQPNSQKDRDLARNRIYEVVMWMFGKGQTHGDPSWLSNHPGIIAYITMGLKDDRVSGSRWLKPIRAILKTFLPEKPFKHRGHSGDILEFLFKMDLAQGIIVCLSRSRDLDDWITATEIMQYCIEASSQFAQQLLNDGFLEILANMILDDNSVLRGHHAHFDYQSRVTGVISQLCAHSLAKAAWSTDSMLLALRRVFTPADWEPTRLMLDVSNQTSAAPFGSSSLVQLAEEVKEHRPAPFFISRNIDVAFNRFCGHRGRQIDWSYCLYEEPETGAACPSIVFAEYELL